MRISFSLFYAIGYLCASHLVQAHNIEHLNRKRRLTLEEISREEEAIEAEICRQFLLHIELNNKKGECNSFGKNIPIQDYLGEVKYSTQQLCSLKPQHSHQQYQRYLNYQQQYQSQIQYVNQCSNQCTEMKNIRPLSNTEKPKLAVVYTNPTLTTTNQVQHQVNDNLTLTNADMLTCPKHSVQGSSIKNKEANKGPLMATIKSTSQLSRLCPQKPKPIVSKKTKIATSKKTSITKNFITRSNYFYFIWLVVFFAIVILVTVISAITTFPLSVKNFYNSFKGKLRFSRKRRFQKSKNKVKSKGRNKIKSKIKSKTKSKKRKKNNKQ